VVTEKQTKKTATMLPRTVTNQSDGVAASLYRAMRRQQQQQQQQQQWRPDPTSEQQPRTRLLTKTALT